MIKVMDSINNHFIRSVETGAYEITSNSIKGGFREIYLKGMHIIIKDSFLNDGIYEVVNVDNGELGLKETLQEEDTGKPIRVIASTPPEHFIELATEITDFKEDKLGIASESIDDYSVSFKGDGTWQEEYKNKLNQYRRVYPDIAGKRW